MRCVGLDVGKGDVELDGEPEREVDQTCKGRGGVAGEVGLESFMESLLVWLLTDADVDNRPRGRDSLASSAAADILLYVGQVWLAASKKVRPRLANAVLEDLCDQ